MQFFHSWKKVPSDFHHCVVAIGNFDGFHQGHRAVVEEAVRIGKKENKHVLLMTFEPHPSGFFRPSERTFRITPIRSKVRAICRLPIDGFFVFNFNEAFANMSAETFVKEVLIEGLHVSSLVVGEDYGFGKGRLGDVNFIRTHFPELSIYAVPKLKDEHAEIISSSRIRSFLRDGEIKKASLLMEHPFEIEGYVIHGDKRGRQIGFPTINIEPKDSIIPRNGVYLASVEIDDKAFKAIANIGKRPTVDGEKTLLEAHILDFSKDLYAKRLRVKLLNFIREERQFSSLQELKEQIKKDVKTVQGIVL